MAKSSILIQELMSIKHLEKILIIYPYALRNEKILQDNILKMKQVVREYIRESELYEQCINTIPNLIWDSQKNSLRQEANEHQRKADELAEVMNNGISPYHWCICNNFDQYIDEKHYKADYAVLLEKQ